MNRKLPAGFRCLILGAAVLLSTADDANGQAQPLVLVHGLNSSPQTWDALRDLMANDGWAIHTPTLGKFAAFVENKVALNYFVCSQGLGSNSVLLGHSMGGIVARSSSRENPFHGVLSIGTPHRGTPLGRSIDPTSFNPFMQVEAELIWLKFEIEAIPNDGTEWANDWISAWEIEDVQARGNQTWWNLQYLNTAGMLGTVGALFGLTESLDALHDLRDDSEAIDFLNTSAWAESGNIRRAFTSVLDAGYMGHQFSFIFDGETADYFGLLMQDNGLQTYFAGWGMQMAGEFSEHWDMRRAGTAVMTVGDAECFYAYWWANAVIGAGFSSDGVVPLWSQQGWPNVAFEAIGFAFHTKETSLLAQDLRTRVNQLFDH